MAARVIEGLAELSARSMARRRLLEDYAAASVLPRCGSADDLLDELRRIAVDDPERARSLYFLWKDRCPK